MKFLKFWLPVFIWCGVIFYFSSIPNLETPWGIGDFILRKSAHITEYFILTFLLYRALGGYFCLSSGNLILWSFMLALLYAVSDEAHQAFVPGRGPTIIDIFIDTTGVSGFLFFKSRIKKW